MIGKNITHALKIAQISQKDLAKLLNITPSAVSNWTTEKREPDVDSVIKICNILNVSSDFLLGLSNEPHIDSIPNCDEMLQQMINAYLQLSPSNKHRLYADCLEYLEDQNSDDTAKRKRGDTKLKRNNDPPILSAK